MCCGPAVPDTALSQVSRAKAVVRDDQQVRESLPAERPIPALGALSSVGPREKPAGAPRAVQVWSPFVLSVRGDNRALCVYAAPASRGGARRGGSLGWILFLPPVDGELRRRKLLVAPAVGARRHDLPPALLPVARRQGGIVAVDPGELIRTPALPLGMRAWALAAVSEQRFVEPLRHGLQQLSRSPPLLSFGAIAGGTSRGSRAARYACVFRSSFASLSSSGDQNPAVSTRSLGPPPGDGRHALMR